MLTFDDSTIAKNIAIASEYFKAYYYVAYKDKKFSGGTTGFIPFNIEFTIDGLSGIKIYNKLRVDTSFLPSGYTKTLDFIVTGVDHKLKDGDWETVIKTTMIPKLESTEVVVTTANFKASIYPQPIKIIPIKITDDPNQPLPAPIDGTNLIIGDSITPNFALNKYNKDNLGLSYTAEGVLWESGKGVKVILKFANAYTLKSLDIKNVIITIGTNDLYIRDQSSVQKLAARLKILFPNAKLFVIQGGYGSLLGKGQTDKYGSYKILQNMLQSTVDTYYKDFSDNGITVITSPIGNVSDVHNRNLPIYETIGKELLKLLKR
jgi:hypothetical protein